MEAQRQHTTEMALLLAMDELEERLGAIHADYADAQWRRHFGWGEEGELDRLEAARSALLLDDRAPSIFRRWQNRVDDPLLMRRMTLLLRQFGWAAVESQPEIYQLRNQIDKAILSQRPRLGGLPASRVERSEILRRHPDRDRRREAWLALAPLSQRIEQPVRRLIALRKDLAGRMGANDYVAWALDHMGIAREDVECLLQSLLQRTEEPYSRWLEQSVAEWGFPDGLKPWDLAFAAEGACALAGKACHRQTALTVAHATAKGVGLGDAGAGVRVDVVDIPYAALCYAVQPPQDVRIILSPRDGHVHYDVVFHEFGHALHWRSLTPTSPIFRYEAPPFNEGMAFLWEWFVSAPDWLMAHGNVTSEQAMTCRQSWQYRTLFRLRLLMARTLFEYQAYQGTDQELLSLYRDIHSRVLGVPYDSAPGWADGPYWTSHPVYHQNYAIGQAIASQILAAIRREFGRYVDEPKVGAWLVEHFYGPGATVPWTDRLQRATRSTLKADDLISDLVLPWSDSDL
jgi:peptidyl-dipeptidase A